jgi:hypothetical protein
VTLPRYHVSVEAGVPKTQAFLWVSGEQWRAVLAHVVWAESRCRYDWRDRQVPDSRDGVLYPTRFASPQGAVSSRNAQESLVVDRPQVLRRQVRQFSSTQQWVVFELR